MVKAFSSSLKFEIISRAMDGKSKTVLTIEHKIQASQIYLWLKNIKNSVIIILSIKREEDAKS